VIYEIHTAALAPGRMPDVLERTLEALPARLEVSPLAAFWRSEIGALNRTVMVWPYRDMAHRAAVLASLGEVPGWPPDTSALLASEQVEIGTPAPFLAPLTTCPSDGVFEVRTYTFRPGTIPNVLDVWSRMVPDRVRLSPLVACWYTDIGVRHRFTHVWWYRSLDERMRVRAEAVQQGIWPPPTQEWRISEESSIVLPVPFAPAAARPGT